MFALLAPERFDRFYPYSLLENLSLIGRFAVSMNIVAPKKFGPETESGDLRKTEHSMELKLAWKF
jgi:hypothetical protein